MAIMQTYQFDNSANYVLNNTVTEGSKAKLALIPNPGQVFAQDFSSDVGFTYDNTKVEFVGGVMRQKDQTPTNSILGGKFSSTKNLNWFKNGASTTGIETGTTTLTGGKLNCLDFGNNSMRFTDASIGNLGDIGTLKFKYTPNYSGTPAQNVNMVEMSPPSGTNSTMLIFHSSTGTVRLTAYTSVGTAKHAAVAFGAVWSPVAGTEYEIELDWDTVAGQVRLFINGVLQGSMVVSSYARGTSATRIFVGAGTTYPVANGSFSDVVCFSTVQHTSGYTPGYTLPAYIYLGSLVNGPNFTYTGVGSVLSIDSGDVSEVGVPRYIIGLRYWNGTAWVISNNSYAQANDFATALAHLDEFVASGGVLPWSVVFTDSNPISSIDEFEVVVTGQKYSPTGYLEPVQALQVAEILSYSHTTVEDLGTSVKVILKIDGVLKYWNGTAWVTSNGTEAQANTATDVNANLDELDLGVNSSVFIRWLLSTSVENDSPEIDSSVVHYNFGAVETPLSTCIVFGYLKDITDTPVVGASIKFELNQKNKFFKEANNNVIGTGSVTVTTDVNGYFSVPLVRSSEFDGETTYKLTITIGSIVILKNSAGYITFTVPDSETKDITDLVAA